MMAGGAAAGEGVDSGNLNVNSHNKPNCLVQWGWHVAPTLQVDINGSPQTYVIDPSLFNEPVPRATWKSVQGDPSATLTPSSADIFYYWGSVTDPTYSKTNAVLTTYRNMLKLRSAGSDGPPPVPELPGQAGRHAVVRIDRGTPDAALVHLGLAGPPARGRGTSCPSRPAPAGRSSRGMSRSNEPAPSQATYWITVKNLSADRVRFAGRYNILS